MSADRWSPCPKCATEKEKEDGEEGDMREDWDISGITNGTLVFSYSAYCMKCKFSFQTEYREDIP